MSSWTGRVAKATSAMAAVLAVLGAGVPAWAGDSAAADLAAIDGHGSARPSVVAKYIRALDRLHRKCPRDTRTHLADMAAVTRQKTHGEASTLQALRGVYRSIPDRLSGKVNCADQFAAYIVLVNGGSRP